MPLASFDDLLRSASQQSRPQRLLFVLTAANPPDDATPEQRARFQAGKGGALTAPMCVTNSPDERSSFTAPCHESRGVGPKPGFKAYAPAWWQAC